MKYTFMRFPAFKSKALTLSYDDGTCYDKQLTEILDAYGLKCTFNLNSGLFPEKDGEWRMSEKEILALFGNSAHEIAVHGYKHLALTEVPEETAVYDIIADRDRLEKMCGKIVKGMAYANGKYSDAVADIVARCGIKYARTTVSTEDFSIPTDWLRLSATCHHKNSRLNELTDKFLAIEKAERFWANQPKLFYLWGHAYEFHNENNWELMENFAKKMGNRSDIWYATNGEIYDYVQAYNRLEYSVSNDIVYNPTNTDVYICLYGKDIFVPSGSTCVVK